MALPDSCPKCGERATNDRGACVFCGTQVIHPKAVLTSDQQSKVTANYQFASWSFVVVGVIYLAIGIIGSVVYKKPLLGLLVTAVVSIAQGGLLIAKNEWMQSVTKMICWGRIVFFVWFLMVLIPFLVVFRVPGMILMAIVIYDLACLVLMVKTIDDVYFG